MMPAARRPGVPRGIAITWALATLVGGITVGIAAAQPEPQPRTLSPRTVARYLANIAPAPRQDVRVNGVYGSGHNGAWQIVAHVTWRNTDGMIDGGVTNLPVLAGEPAWDSPIDRSRFDTEHAMGWTLNELATVLARLDDTDDDLALVELEITDVRQSVIACHGSRADLLGRCVERDRRGREVRTFVAPLTDNPLGQALAVQRA